MEKLLALLNKLSKTLQAKGNHVEDGSNPAEPENTAEIVDKHQKKLSKKKLGVIGCIFRKNCASVPEERSAIPLQTEQSSAG